MGEANGTLSFDDMVVDANNNPEEKINPTNTIYKLGNIVLGKIDSYDNIDTLKFTFDRNIQENVNKPTYWVKKNEYGKLVISITGTSIDNVSPLEETTLFEIVTPAVNGGKKRRRKTAKNARKTNKRMKKRKSNRRR